MKERLLRIAKWAVYPAFYVACLALFFLFGDLRGQVKLYLRVNITERQVFQFALDPLRKLFNVTGIIAT